MATASGATVPLSAVARFELAQGPTAIDRYDRMRRVLVGADLVGNAPLGKAVDQMLALPAAKNLPAGVELKQFGDAEIMGEVFASFAAAMGAGIMMVYAVLVLLFGSFLQPITILFSLPLVDRRRHRRARRHRPVDQPAGGDRHPDADGHRHQERHHAGRLRHRGDAPRHRRAPRPSSMPAASARGPIVMTTIAMIAGMLPAAIGSDSGGEFRAPMAIAVIGGLISSTLLSLVFVPAVFAVMDDIGRLAWRVFSRFVGPTEEEPAAAAAPPAVAQAGAAAAAGGGGVGPWQSARPGQRGETATPRRPGPPTQVSRHNAPEGERGEGWVGQRKARPHHRCTLFWGSAGC